MNKQTVHDGFARYGKDAVGNGCLLWLGSTDRDGYGKFNSEGKVIAAHRAAFILFYGQIPDGAHVLHRCDNPRCVNPAHLYAGTHADNMRDAAQKGRFDKGRDTRRISAETKLAIATAEGPKRGIARRFGVSAQAVRTIKRHEVAR